MRKHVQLEVPARRIDFRVDHLMGNCIGDFRGKIELESKSYNSTEDFISILAMQINDKFMIY